MDLILTKLNDLEKRIEKNEILLNELCICIGLCFDNYKNDVKLFIPLDMHVLTINIYEKSYRCQNNFMDIVIDVHTLHFHKLKYLHKLDHLELINKDDYFNKHKFDFATINNGHLKTLLLKNFRFTTLETINKLDKLENLQIIDFKELIHINEFINKCKSLKQISVINCPKIDNINLLINICRNKDILFEIN